MISGVSPSHAIIPVLTCPEKITICPWKAQLRRDYRQKTGFRNMGGCKRLTRGSVAHGGASVPVTVLPFYLSSSTIIATGTSPRTFTRLLPRCAQAQNCIHNTSGELVYGSCCALEEPRGTSENWLKNVLWQPRKHMKTCETY